MSIVLHCVRRKSSTLQKVSQLVQNCGYLPEILNSTTVAIFTQDPKAFGNIRELVKFMSDCDETLKN